MADASGSGRDDERRVRPRTPSGRTGRADDSGGIGPTLGVVGAVGMGVAAALAGLGTLGLAGVAGYSMLEYSTTNLQVPAANALGRAFLFGTLTFLSGATTLVLGGCSGGLYWWTRPAEDE